jgi:hypothetical protein
MDNKSRELKREEIELFYKIHGSDNVESVLLHNTMNETNGNIRHQFIFEDKNGKLKNYRFIVDEYNNVVSYYQKKWNKNIATKCSDITFSMEPQEEEKRIEDIIRENKI